MLEPSGTTKGFTNACSGTDKWYSPKIGGPQYRPQNTVVLIIGTPKGTHNFGNPLISQALDLVLRQTWSCLHQDEVSSWPTLLILDPLMQSVSAEIVGETNQNQLFFEQPQ